MTTTNLHGYAISDLKSGEAKVTHHGAVIGTFPDRSVAEAHVRTLAARDQAAVARREKRAADAYAAILPRLRKVVNREPGFAVNSLGNRCVAVPAYWGAPVRTCIVIMAEGADVSGTHALHSDDLAMFESALESDDTLAIVERHA